VNSDHRSRVVDDVGSTSDFDSTRPPRISAGEVIDHDGGAATALDVPILLRLGELLTPDVNSVVLVVVAPSDGRNMGGAVLPDSRQTAESTLF
jgi:hypothetical protein